MNKEIKDIQVSSKTKEYFENKNCKTVEDARKLTLLDLYKAIKEGYDEEELLKVMFDGE